MSVYSRITMGVLFLSLASAYSFAGQLSTDQVSLELNVLKRDSDSNTIYLYNNNGTVNNSVDDIPLAGTGSFDANADTGYRLSGSKSINTHWSVNAGVLTSDLSKTDSFNDPSSQLEIFRLPITANFDAANSVSAAYSSKLQNIEVNAVYRYSDNLDLFAGVTQLKLDEQFRITSDDSLAAGIGVYTINTNNKLLGPQLGLSYSYKPNPKYSLYFTGKLAWLNNDARQDQVVNDSPTFTRNNSASGSHASTMYDARVGVNYYFVQNATLGLGYQYIKVTDVALAESQFNTTSAGSNTLAVNDSISWSGFSLTLGYYF
ncbi:MAG: BBP7 family outer membrane beta-barrel protein [Gammaproteobacteria bacterium]|nr:BBP7 family outer membrane beta-barrel protein [Gammaproteobacteria bacterium]